MGFRTQNKAARSFDNNRTTVADIAFDRVTMAEAVERILHMTAIRENPCHVCTGNLDHLAMMERHSNGEELRRVYETANLVLADGMPIVWLSRLAKPKQQHLPERVAGSDLVWELAQASAETGLRLFLLGGAPGAADKTAKAMMSRFSHVVISGVYCPPFESFDTETEQAHIRRRIHEAAPDVLLVAFGAPKQERWILANKAALGVPVSIGVGGSFEMACGSIRRAPHWMRQTGFEWLFRLIQEPQRLYGRYIQRDLPFLFQLAARQAGQRTGNACLNIMSSIGRARTLL